uniref:Uncharacterized protein n=1 Tax=Vitis vinifera TaxID=29760 RepID=F6HDI7_VITVI
MPKLRPYHPRYPRKRLVRTPAEHRSCNTGHTNYRLDLSLSKQAFRNKGEWGEAFISKTIAVLQRNEPNINLNCNIKHAACRYDIPYIKMRKLINSVSPDNLKFNTGRKRGNLPNHLLANTTSPTSNV